MDDECSFGPARITPSPAIDTRDEEDHREAEDGDEGDAHAVLSSQERLGAVLNVAVDLAKFLIGVRLAQAYNPGKS